jgi:hypothetical protein
LFALAKGMFAAINVAILVTPRVMPNQLADNDG